MPSLFRTPTPRVFMSSILLAILWQALSIGARAEVLVTGEPDAVQVDAKEASVEELLSALRKAYGLQYWSSANLSRSVSGTYAGSLQQVVSRVLSLQGYNFIAENENAFITGLAANVATMAGSTNLVTDRRTSSEIVQSWAISIVINPASIPAPMAQPSHLAQ